jgi:hypothetical protein
MRIGRRTRLGLLGIGAAVALTVWFLRDRARILPERIQSEDATRGSPAFLGARGAAGARDRDAEPASPRPVARGVDAVPPDVPRRERQVRVRVETEGASVGCVVRLYDAHGRVLVEREVRSGEATVFADQPDGTMYATAQAPGLMATAKVADDDEVTVLTMAPASGIEGIVAREVSGGGGAIAWEPVANAAIVVLNGSRALQNVLLGTRDAPLARTGADGRYRLELPSAAAEDAWVVAWVPDLGVAIAEGSGPVRDVHFLRADGATSVRRIALTDEQGRPLVGGWVVAGEFIHLLQTGPEPDGLLHVPWRRGASDVRVFAPGTRPVELKEPSVDVGAVETLVLRTDGGLDLWIVDAGGRGVPDASVWIDELGAEGRFGPAAGGVADLWGRLRVAFVRGGHIHVKAPGFETYLGDVTASAGGTQRVSLESERPVKIVLPDDLPLPLTITVLQKSAAEEIVFARDFVLRTRETVLKGLPRGRLTGAISLGGSLGTISADLRGAERVEAPWPDDLVRLDIEVRGAAAVDGATLELRAEGFEREAPKAVVELAGGRATMFVRAVGSSRDRLRIAELPAVPSLEVTATAGTRVQRVRWDLPRDAGELVAWEFDVVDAATGRAPLGSSSTWITTPAGVWWPYGKPIGSGFASSTGRLRIVLDASLTYTARVDGGTLEARTFGPASARDLARERRIELKAAPAPGR